MVSDFEFFKERIVELKQDGNLNEDVLLILRGRIEDAMERDYLTMSQARELIQSLGDDFMRRSESAAILASLGEVMPQYAHYSQ